MLLLRCHRCHGDFPPGDFDRLPARGARSCRACSLVQKAQAAKRVKWRNEAEKEVRAEKRAAAPPPPPYVPPLERACTHCKTVKPLFDFPKGQCRDGTGSWCKKCTQAAGNASKKKRCEADPEYREKLAADKRAARAAMTPEQAAAERARLDAVSERASAAREQKREHDQAVRIAKRIDAMLADHSAHVVAYRALPPPPPVTRSSEPHIPAGAGANRVKKLRRKHAVWRATPPWADLAALQAVYDAAKMLRTVTGADWQVDHAIPLRGRLVSGLHCPDNLNLVPGDLNARKGNHYRI